MPAEIREALNDVHAAVEVLNRDHQAAVTELAFIALRSSGSRVSSARFTFRGFSPSTRARSTCTRATIPISTIRIWIVASNASSHALPWAECVSIGPNA
jgi:hypothetical protein